MKHKKAYLAGSMALATVLLWLLNYFRNGTNLWWALLLALGTVIMLLQQKDAGTKHD